MSSWTHNAAYAYVLPPVESLQRALMEFARERRRNFKCEDFVRSIKFGPRKFQNRNLGKQNAAYACVLPPVKSLKRALLKFACGKKDSGLKLKPYYLFQT